jgi:hypothetical protein
MVSADEQRCSRPLEAESTEDSALMWQQSVDDGHAPITPGAAPRARSARFAAAGLGLCVCAVVGVSTARRDATGSGGGAAAAAGSVAALASRAAAGAATAAGALEALAFDDDDSTIGNFSAKFNATSEREGHDSAVCKLYKRTMTSYNAYEDAEFLRNYLGLELQATSTPSPVVAPCFHPPPPRVVLQRHGGRSPVRDSN